MENNVFLHLRRFYGEIFYFRKNKECDFLVRERGAIKLCIQVTFELNNDNKERKISGLLEAMDEVKLDEGLSMTYDQEDEFTLNRKRILVRPAWKWISDSAENKFGINHL